MIKSAYPLFVILFITLSINIFSLPRFQVKLGNKCIDCHYNPTGGNMRNLDGWNWGKNTLSMVSTRDKDFKMSPRLNDNIGIGLDFRPQFLYSQEMNKADFQPMTGSVYANVSISEKINVLGRYDFVNQIYEGYAVARILPGEGYIKAGTFTPAYGIRLDDHTAYTRGGDIGLLFSQGVYQGLIFNPFYTEAGIEAGFYLGDHFLATASAGANLLSNRTLSKDPTYTARVEFSPVLGSIGLLAGGSYSAAKIPSTAFMYGGFAGFGMDEFSLLAEFDMAEGVMGEGLESNVLMVEATYGVFTGLEVVVRYDRIDPDNNAGNDDQAHIVAGVEFHPFQFIEIRPQYRFTIEDPAVKNDAVVIQMHFWY